jgi:hypothetical protein
MNYFRSIPALQTKYEETRQYLPTNPESQYLYPRQKAKYDKQGREVPSEKELQSNENTEDEWYEKKNLVELLYQDIGITNIDELISEIGYVMREKRIMREEVRERVIMTLRGRSKLSNVLYRFSRIDDVIDKNDEQFYRMLKEAMTKDNEQVYIFLKSSSWIETKSENDLEYYRWTPRGWKFWKIIIDKRMELIKSSKSRLNSQVKYDAEVPQPSSGIILNGGHSTIDHDIENNIELLINKISDWE